MSRERTAGLGVRTSPPPVSAISAQTRSSALSLSPSPSLSLSLPLSRARMPPPPVIAISAQTRSSAVASEQRRARGEESLAWVRPSPPRALLSILGFGASGKGRNWVWTARRRRRVWMVRGGGKDWIACRSASVRGSVPGQITDNVSVMCKICGGPSYVVYVRRGAYKG